MADQDATRQVDDTIPMAGQKRTIFEFPAEFDHSAIPFEEKRYPVLIIGSSMVGMTLGVLLGYHGIESISFDRHPSTAIHPRAALFTLRTMEIFRQLGLDQRFRANSETMFDLDAGMLISDKLIGGKVLMSMQESDPVETAKVTPAVRMWLTQNMFEPLLRSSARDFGAVQQFSETVVHYEELPDGVTTVVQNNETGQLKKYRSDVLVAVDGNRSATRAKEGIAWHGPGVLGSAISVNFRADLRPYLGTRAKHGVTYVTNPKVDGGFRLESEGKAGFMIVTRVGERDSFEPDSVTAADARRYFLDAAGLEDEEDFAIHVDSINYWSIAGFTAERMASKGGRVFLAGDAAHVMPPTGGMGGNTGCQDVYNLAWKLAYFVKGRASLDLLRTYNTERQPVAEWLVRQAYSRFQARVRRTKPDEPELPDVVCEIGYRYPTGAVVHQAGDHDQLLLYEDPYAPLVEAGSRLPHAWLVAASDGSTGISTLDLVKQNFVVIAAAENSPWLEAAKKLPFPVDGYALTKSSTPYRWDKDEDGGRLKLAEGEALLVRPDGYIGWRAPRVASGHLAWLKAALGTILSKEIQ